VNVVRAFGDGDFVFGHTEYDFSSRRVGFEVFRFEGDFAVEHWDNIQLREGPNPSRHSMIDGAMNVSDLGRTEGNRDMVRAFIETVRIEREVSSLGRLCLLDSLYGTRPAWCRRSSCSETQPGEHDKRPAAADLPRLHRVLAQGSFVLTVSERLRDGMHTSFYDLYRIEGAKIVEHWNTKEVVAPPEEWQYSNASFERADG
jgi:predicted SnoaL-like aldol condensation-catalyzing enzyme